MIPIGVKSGKRSKRPFGIELGWSPSATHLSTAQVQGSWSASQQQAYLNPWRSLQRHVDEADDLPIPTPAELAAQSPTAAQAWLVNVMGSSRQRRIWEWAGCTVEWGRLR